MHEEPRNDEGAPVDDLGGTSLEELTASEQEYYSSAAPTPQNTPSEEHESHLPKYALAILAVMVLLVATAVIAATVARKTAKKATPTPVTINTQSLDNGTLTKLTTKAAASGGGQVTQQLTVTPDTLYKGVVDIQGSIKAQKSFELGGNLDVKGSSIMQGAVSINNNLAVHGALSVGGALSAASISVDSLNISTIKVSGNLAFGGHILPSGAQPSAKASNASGGGTISISGNDTAGTITINVGNGTLFAGELAAITFRTPFATTPKVQLTPVNSEASNMHYFVTRTTSFMTIETSTVASAGATYVFDYLVTQ